jgi:hypothetical protein
MLFRSFSAYPRRYDDQFWKSLLKGDSKRSREENIKELGF